MTDAQQIADALLPNIRPYIVLESQSPPHSIWLPGAIGTTSRTLDLLLHPWLTDRGEWRGRHPAIFIADDTIHEMVAAEVGNDRTKFAAIYDQAVAAVVCHEAGHISESQPDLSEPTAERREFSEAIAAYSVAIADNSPWPPMFGHSAHFVRNAIHLAYRANMLGYVFPIHMLYCGENYQIAEPENFQYLLGREALNLAGESIFNIRTYRPPLNFVRLWQRCIRRWIDRQPAGAVGVETALQLLDCDPWE